jgi:DNA-binding PadR family transcriptional regulator
MDRQQSALESRRSNASPRDPQAMLPLTPAVFHILLVLGKQDFYGLAIMQEVERMTKGQVRLGPGTLYRSLQRMVLEGLIEEHGDYRRAVPRDERHRVYRLTPFGMQVARQEARRLALLVDEARARGFLMRDQEELP